MLGKLVIASLLVREVSEQLIELGERHAIFHQARDYANNLGKPLLVVGAPKSLPWVNHPCGDATIDINPDLNSPCDYLVADVRKIPYPNNNFGAAYISHVLEHLATIDDAYQALNELHRVADKVFVVSPHKSSIMAWVYPGHHLWILAAGDGFIIEQKGNTKHQGSYIASFVVY